MLRRMRDATMAVMVDRHAGFMKTATENRARHAKTQAQSE
jgi:hypothetical protein